jgi:uncharacterized protein YndB with AHSA1/START domain
MTTRQPYFPGPANGARAEKNGDQWTLVVVRQLRHSPQTVWAALTDPAQLREWAPFDADGSLDSAGRAVKLSTAGAPQVPVSETTITRADAPHLLEYNWGDQLMRWQLEDYDGGTRLTLCANIHRPYIAMGAAGWHICLDVLDRWLAGSPVGRIVGSDALQFGDWHRLHAEYASRFGMEMAGKPA